MLKDAAGCFLQVLPRKAELRIELRQGQIVDLARFNNRPSNRFSSARRSSRFVQALYVIFLLAAVFIASSVLH